MYNIYSWKTYLEHLLRLIYLEVGEEDEECDYDHTLIDDFSAHGGDKETYSVGEDNSNMCKDVVIKMELM